MQHLLSQEQWCSNVHYAKIFNSCVSKIIKALYPKATVQTDLAAESMSELKPKRRDQGQEGILRATLKFDTKRSDILSVVIFRLDWRGKGKKRKKKKTCLYKESLFGLLPRKETSQPGRSLKVTQTNLDPAEGERAQLKSPDQHQLLQSNAIASRALFFSPRIWLLLSLKILHQIKSSNVPPHL